MSNLAKSRASVIAGSLLAVIGGVLILQSGVSTRSFLMIIMSESETRFGGSLPGIAKSLVNIIIIGLGTLIALGGLLAIIGGILVLLNHRLSGKILIALGGGMGFFGIALSMGYDVFMTGLSALFIHVEYWIGILIASIGRYLV